MLILAPYIKQISMWNYDHMMEIQAQNRSGVLQANYIIL